MPQPGAIVTPVALLICLVSAMAEGASGPATPAGMPLPACVARPPDTTPEQALKPLAVPAGELLARLVYAEGTSTGFGDDPRVLQGIAWGVMNRVRLGEASSALRRVYGAGVAGVVFQKGQFNPAVSKRSPFSRDFLCPDRPDRWSLASAAAQVAMKGEDNPFIETAWERSQGLSLVVNFYYPASIQAREPTAPWEASSSLRFIGDVRIDGQTLPASRVRFYRLTRAPRLEGQPPLEK